MMLTVSATGSSSERLQALISPVNAQNYFLANKGVQIHDPQNATVYMSDLSVVTDHETSKVSGELFLTAASPRYVNANLAFYDHQNNLGIISIDDDYQSGKNTWELRMMGDLSNFSTVSLQIRDIHPALKSIVKNLYAAAKDQDQLKVESLEATIPDEADKYLLVDFFKWSVPYAKEWQEFLLPYLLTKKVDVNWQDKTNGYTALMYASYHSIDLVKPLVEAGADVTIQGNDGTTALLLIAAKNRPDLVKMLLDQGADPNQIGVNGYTPLLAALRPLFAKYTEATITSVHYLLDAGANVNVQLPDGTSPHDLIHGIQLPEIAEPLTALLNRYRDIR
ncbi:ankyrin repeat domain-containing protein [Paenibacillus filicis]